MSFAVSLCHIRSFARALALAGTRSFGRVLAHAGPRLFVVSTFLTGDERVRAGARSCVRSLVRVLVGWRSLVRALSCLFARSFVHLSDHRSLWRYPDRAVNFVFDSFVRALARAGARSCGRFVCSLGRGSLWKYQNKAIVFVFAISGTFFVCIISGTFFTVVISGTFFSVVYSGTFFIVVNI